MVRRHCFARPCTEKAFAHFRAQLKKNKNKIIFRRTKITIIIINVVNVRVIYGMGGRKRLCLLRMTNSTPVFDKNDGRHMPIE